MKEYWRDFWRLVRKQQIVLFACSGGLDHDSEFCRRECPEEQLEYCLDNLLGCMASPHAREIVSQEQFKEQLRGFARTCQIVGRKEKTNYMEIVVYIDSGSDIDGADVVHLPRSKVDETTRNWKRLAEQLPLEIWIPNGEL